MRWGGEGGGMDKRWCTYMGVFRHRQECVTDEEKHELLDVLLLFCLVAGTAAETWNTTTQNTEEAGYPAKRGWSVLGWAPRVRPPHPSTPHAPHGRGQLPFSCLWPAPGGPALPPWRRQGGVGFQLPITSRSKFFHIQHALPLPTTGTPPRKCPGPPAPPPAPPPSKQRP